MRTTIVKPLTKVTNLKKPTDKHRYTQISQTRHPGGFAQQNIIIRDPQLACNSTLNIILLSRPPPAFAWDGVLNNHFLNIKKI